jgi:hypothetical protein
LGSRVRPVPARQPSMLRHPQLSGDLRYRNPPLELLHRRQPDQLPPSAPLSG